MPSDMICIKRLNENDQNHTKLTSLICIGDESHAVKSSLS
jgi:hypothetical protein